MSRRPDLAASAADRRHEQYLERFWPPPREGAPRTAATVQVGNKYKVEGFPKYRPTDSHRKAETLDRRADLLLSFGHHAAAERLAHLAETIRRAVAA